MPENLSDSQFSTNLSFQKWTDTLKRFCFVVLTQSCANDQVVGFRVKVGFEPSHAQAAEAIRLDGNRVPVVFDSALESSRDGSTSEVVGIEFKDNPIRLGIDGRQVDSADFDVERIGLASKRQ